ncbi:MAG: hypothetical protein ABIW31_03000 [Novosphingobium sp.]
MSVGRAAEQGSKTADAASSWRAIRGDGSIQFTPVEFKPDPPPQIPAWLAAFGRFLRKLFEPLGELIGLSWPVMSYVLIGLALLAAALLIWRMVAPLLEGRRRRVAAEAEAEWAPGQAAALSLLEDADRLAGEGRYDEAAHLLLSRSVGEIAASRPDWVHPASTAREIALHPDLPGHARTAFALIARQVERSRFALVPLILADWQEARAAYAEFALAGISR